MHTRLMHDILLVRKTILHQQYTKGNKKKIWGKMEDMIPFTDIKIRIARFIFNQPTKITYNTSLHLYSPLRVLPF